MFIVHLLYADMFNAHHAGKKSVDDILYFCQLWHFMQIVSLGDNLHEMSKPVLREIYRNNIFNLSYSVFVHRVVKVNDSK